MNENKPDLDCELTDSDRTILEAFDPTVPEIPEGEGSPPDTILHDADFHDTPFGYLEIGDAVVYDGEFKEHPILALDFDGVLHSYMSPWEGADVISDGPVDGAQEFVAVAAKVMHVVIHSSRCHQPGGIKAMHEWMQKHDFVDVEFALDKPPAHVTLDDRAVRFKGNFPDIGFLVNNKTWNRV